jgi:hypothetical protein
MIHKRLGTLVLGGMLAASLAACQPGGEDPAAPGVETPALETPMNGFETPADGLESPVDPFETPADGLESPIP